LFQGAGKEEEKKGAGDRQTDRQTDNTPFRNTQNVCKDYIRNSGTLCKTHLHLKSICLLALYLTSLAPVCVFLAFKEGLRADLNFLG
jgi:hypothetical protein